MALKPSPQPRRAAELERAEPRQPRTLWPFLQVVSCWGDAHAGPALAELRRQIPDVTIEPKGLLATECAVTVPFLGQRPVAVRSHFFEFIDERGRIRRLHELTPNGIYELVVTTAGGLWRYRLGDLVEVNGCVGRTPALHFLGRNGNVSDRFGEKLSEAFVARAIEETVDSESARFAMLAPDDSGTGIGYTLYVEGETRPALAENLDRALRRNPHYAWCRDFGQLQPLRVFRIHGRAYEEFVARQMARGARLGEIKPCPLSGETDWSSRFSGSYVSPAPARLPDRLAAFYGPNRFSAVISTARRERFTRAGSMDGNSIPPTPTSR
jgi:hypothetical protein